MIVPAHFELIFQALTKSCNLFEALEKYNISPIEFFVHLSKNPDDAMKFEQSRQISVERMIAEGTAEIGRAVDRFQLDKAIAKFKATQWLAEKIIPKTYGQKIDVQHNVTIDIAGALAEARKRIVREEESIPVIGKALVAADLLGE